MAVNAKFQADFQSFFEAVSKADHQLKGFETSTAKLNTSLSKLTHAFSGQKIIQEATLAAEAVLRIGGASKLTEAEQASVNKTVTAALEKYKALGMEAPAALRMMAEETKKIEQATAPASKTMQGFLDHFKATVAGMVSAQAIIGGVKAAFGALTDFVSSSVKSYAEAEAAQKKLTTALTSAGRATPQVIQQFSQMSREFQKTTVYSDDLITEMQALLVEVGSVMPHQMQGALQAATNLASGLGIDLRQATMLVGKAFEGETGTLKRYGIVIDEAKLKAEGLPAVLDAIQQRFGGQAQAEAETYAGKVKQLANAWDDFKEAVGKAIVDDPVIQRSLKALAEQVQGTGEAAEEAGGSFTAFAVGLVANSPALRKYIDILASMQRFLDATEASARKLSDALPRPGSLTGGFSRPNQFGTQPADVDEIHRLWQAQLKAEEAAKKHAEAISALRDQLSGAKLQGDVKKLTEAFKQLTPAQKQNAEIMDRVGTAALRLWKDGATLTPELFRILLATERLTPEMTALSAEMLHSLGPAFKLVYDQGVKLPTVLNGISGSIGHVFEMKIPDAVKQTKHWKDSVDDLARAFAQLSQVSDGKLGDVTRDIGKLVAVWDVAIKAVDAYKEAQGALGKIAGAVSLFGAIGSAAGTVIDIFKKLFGPTEYEKRVRAEAAAMKQLMDDAVKAAGSMDRLRIAADLVGISIDAAFKSRDPKFLQDVLDDMQLRTQKLTAAMEEYGFTWEDLGDKARQSKLTEIAEDLLEKTKLLMGAGIDHDEILKRQANDYIDLIKTAVRTGTEIPASLKAVIEELTKMGLLVDENGNALEELGQLKFAETMTEGFKGVRDELRNIANILQGQFPSAIKTAFDAIPREVDIELRARKTGDWETRAERERDGFATGTPGLGYVNFGGGTPTWLHGREAVVPESRVGELAAQIAAALGGGNNGGSTEPAVINVYVGNEQLDAHIDRVGRTKLALGSWRSSTSPVRAY